MRFVSTRGTAPALSFSDAILTGLARDGGLYVPGDWPQIDKARIESFATARYQDVAKAVLEPFAGDDFPGDLDALVEAAYATFRHEAVTPLVEFSAGRYVLELFHGPTLAFKDVAMQLLARMMDSVLTARGERATIVGATSGDTGSAAIEAFRGRDNIDIFILHPEGRTSEVQRRQMTTVLDANVHNIAIRGTFDDCQTLVKALFNNHSFRDRVKLAGVNSINWGRIVAQIVYYFKAGAQLGAPHRKIGFCVPTGNFGDIFAGYAAMRMGLPVDRLVIATNENDILARTLETGRYERGGVHVTSSPSMDIQVSSNFERLLFEAGGRDGEAVVRMMAGLGQSGAFGLPEATLDAIRRDFFADRADQGAVAEALAGTFARSGYLADPHTGVGLAVAGRVETEAPLVTLATAHPAKFPEAVVAATGMMPALPPFLADLATRPERYEVLDNNASALENFIGARARVES